MVKSLDDISHSDSDPSPKVVAFGGGTGMSILLSGLKAYARDIRAVVTVSDNGGSSGRIARDFEISPPGDFRNCLLALSEVDPLLKKLLSYRFEEGDVLGHSVGNLLLTALTRETGNFEEALEEAGRLLGVSGGVYPATNRRVVLVASHPDGSRSSGETQIVASRKRIDHVRLLPDPGRVSSQVREAILGADLIILGPGSLYTSVIPNLLVGGMVEAIRESGAPVVAVINIMTQRGETDRYTAGEHLRALLEHSEPGFVDYCLVHQGDIPESALDRYVYMGSEVVELDVDVFEREGVELLRDDLVDVGEFIRHDPGRLARAVLKLLNLRSLI
ncbi:MAG: YvcK family protein [Planctomycetota bacterium]|jgi:uncharacterized cofD-like protein|nr:YvcK family protein [Planctomycetota bacterium]